MNISWIFFLLLILISGGVTLMLMWHWKTYLPESGKGANIFLLYIIGLAILFIGFFGTLTSI